MKAHTVVYLIINSLEEGISDSKDDRLPAKEFRIISSELQGYFAALPKLNNIGLCRHLLSWHKMFSEKLLQS